MTLDMAWSITLHAAGSAGLALQTCHRLLENKTLMLCDSVTNQMMTDLLPSFGIFTLEGAEEGNLTPQSALSAALRQQLMCPRVKETRPLTDVWGCLAGGCAIIQRRLKRKQARGADSRPQLPNSFWERQAPAPPLVEDLPYIPAQPPKHCCCGCCPSRPRCSGCNAGRRPRLTAASVRVASEPHPEL